MAHVERFSRTLDVFGQWPGSLLVRGEEVWEALRPGRVGQVLKVLPGGRPGWGEAAGRSFFISASAMGTNGSRIGGPGGVPAILMDQNNNINGLFLIPLMSPPIRVTLFVLADPFGPISSPQFVVFRVEVLRHESFDPGPVAASVDEVFEVVQRKGYAVTVFVDGYDLGSSVDMWIRVWRLGSDTRDTFNGWVSLLAVLVEAA